MSRVLLLLYFVVVTSAFSATRWICIESPHFLVYSEAGEGVAKGLLGRLELARDVLGVRDTVPARVVIFASEREFRAVRPAEPVVGFYQSGPDYDYIAMQASSVEAPRVAVHECVHLLLSHSSAVLPQWLEEGLAEFYSTLEPGGGRVRIGRPITSHQTTLSSQRWLSASELARVDQASPYYNETSKVGIFFAQSWALAHMLNLSPDYRAGFEPFVAAMTRGEAPATAFEAGFHKTMDQAVADLRAYLDRPLPVVDVDAAGAKAGEYTKRDVPEFEAAGLRADLLFLTGRGKAAEDLYREMFRKYPESAQARIGLATIALRAKQFDEAKRRFDEAIELGAKDGATLFEYAMLLRDTGAPRDQVTAYLRKAVAASPKLAEAQFLLGVRASDDEHYQEAVEHLRQAVAVLPRQLYFWHALAWASYRSGDLNGAREAANRARNAAVTDEEIAMADAALRLTRPPDPVAPRKAEVTTPGSWDNPAGDATAEGRLTQVDCGATARLHIGALVLEVTDPNRVTLSGTREGKAELRCGAQDVAVRVEYKRASREVTRIEFR